MNPPNAPSCRPLIVSFSRVFRLASALIVGVGAINTQAADLQWDPTLDQTNLGGSGIWDLTALQWNDDNVAPNVPWNNATFDTAIFGGTAGLVTIDTGVAGTGVSVGGLRFNVDGYFVGPDETTELITLGGASATIHVETGGATISSTLAGTGFTKTGSGTLNLRPTGANTFVGAVNINGGTVSITDDNQLGDVANVVNLDGGRIDYSGAAQWDPAASRIFTLGAGGGTFASSIAIRMTDAGQITGSGNLIREGTGTTFALDLQQANVGFTGNTIINSSVIEFRNNQAFGVGAGQNVTVNGGILAIATGPQTGNFAPKLTQPVTLAGGALGFGNQIGGTVAGNVSVTADSAISVRDFYQAANRGGALTGMLSGSNRLTVSGVTGGFVGGTPNVGSVLLTNPGNTFSGILQVDGGAQVRSVQGGGVDALGAATIELNGAGVAGGVLGLAPVVTAAGSSEGLFGRYYNSTKIGNGVVGGFDFGTEPLALTRLDGTINYTNTVPTGPGVNTTNLGVLWTGILKVEQPGTYAFSFRSDDGSVIYVNGQMVVANDFSQGANERFGSMDLAAGFHPVIIKYGQGTGGAAAQAFYNGPDTGSTKVPFGSVANTVTNSGATLFPDMLMDNEVRVISTGDIDLAGANATSSGPIVFSPGATFRVTGVTGFESLTQIGAVTLNGSNTISAGVTLTANQTNTHGHSSSGADMVILGEIGEASPGSTFIKDGPRKVTLLGGSSFSGGIVVNGGTLAGNTTSITPNVTINNGTLEFAQAANGEYAGILSGAGTLLKSGTGRLLLTGANTFTGTTQITGGVLAGATTLPGTISVRAGGAIGGVAGVTFNVNNLGFDLNSGAAFELGVPGVQPQLNATGAFTTGLTAVTLTDAGGLAAGLYRLIDYAGAAMTPTQFRSFAVKSGPTGFYYGLVNNTADTAVDLLVETPAATNSWTGATNGTWDAGTSENWSLGTFAAGQQATFSDGGTNRVISGPTVSPQRVLVNSSAGNDYTINNAITGMLIGGLVKSGTSTLTLNGANSFDGPIQVLGGTLAAGVSSTINPLSSSVMLAPDTVLQFNPTALTNVNGLTSRYFTTAADAVATGTTSLSAFNFTQAAATVQTDVNFDPAAYNTTNQPAGGLVGFQEGTGANWKNFGIERVGKIRIDREGWYGFHTVSDDASRIFINGRLVANADGGHGNQEGNGAIYLTPGLHDFRYNFLQGSGGADERLMYSGPGIPKQVIPSSVVYTAESSTLFESSNLINVDTPVTAQGNATLRLNGENFIGVQVPTLVTNGGTVTIAGSEGKLLRAGTTAFNASVTLDADADFAPGKINDLGSAVTISKTGSGRLILDHRTGGLDASVISAGTTFDIQEGALLVTHSNVPGTVSPLGGAIVNMNGGDVLIDSLVSGFTLANPFNVLKSGTLSSEVRGQTVALTGGITIAAGATLTLNAGDGARGSNANTTIAAQSVAGATINVASGISGEGNLVIQSDYTVNTTAPINGSVFIRRPASHTGMTMLKGNLGSQVVLDIRGQGTLLATQGVNTPGEIALTNARLNLHNNDGGNLGNRIPDAFPIRMHYGTLRFDGANGTSANETVGPLILEGGQNNLFGGTTSGSAFQTLTAASVTRQNRSTLRVDANALGSLTAATGVRFVFTDPTGFTSSLVGGDGSTGTNTPIIPWVWGGPTGNDRALVTYGANGLRVLAATEYSTLATSTDPQDNIRQAFNANSTIGSGAAQTVNSLVVVNTATGDRTMTLAAGTTLNITSGALVLGTTDGTARRVVLTGGAINFGAAEGILVASRREHSLNSQLSGTGGITIAGDGGLTLNNSLNDFSGDIYVGAGGSNVPNIISLFAQDDGSLGAPTNDLYFDGSSFRFNTSFTLGLERTVNIGPAGVLIDTNNQATGIAGQVTGPGALFKLNSNTLALTNPTNNYTGDTYIAGGNLVTNSVPQGNIHHYSVDGGGFSGTNRILTFDQSFDGLYTGNIYGVGDFVKSGTGRVVMTGIHTYVGTTTINDGGLIVNGSISGSTTSLNAGVLGGNGSLANDLTVGNSFGSQDAILDPGEGGIGTLTVGGSVQFNTDAALLIEIDTTTITTDRLAVDGAVTLGLDVMPVDFSDLGFGTLAGGQVFTFLTAEGGVTGQFLGLPDGETIFVGSTEFTIDYTANSVSLIAVPEPGAFVSLLGGLALLVGTRRVRRGA